MERIPNEMSKVKVYSVKVYLCAATDLELLVAPLQEGLQGSLLHRLRRLRSPVYRPEQQFRFLHKVCRAPLVDPPKSGQKWLKCVLTWVIISPVFRTLSHYLNAMAIA